MMDRLKLEFQRLRHTLLTAAHLPDRSDASHDATVENPGPAVLPPRRQSRLYQPLDKTKREIRLLELQPGSRTDPV
jgi:hypothetical protein